MTEPGTIVVMAKAPVPGRVKTRLCPPCSPEEAAALAAAALADTLTAVFAVPGGRRVLALEGAPGPWLPPGFAVIPQRGGGLDERLEAAFADVFAAAAGPVVLVGMDTPQVTPGLLADALGGLRRPGVDAVLGLALDGGWWAAGLRRPVAGGFVGVPMSTAETGLAQLRRFAALGLQVGHLPSLADIDDITTALSVAEEVPGSRFASCLGEVLAGHVPALAGSS